MIEIIVRNTERKDIEEKATGTLGFFATVNDEGVRASVRGRGTNTDFTLLYSLLKDVTKDIESKYPVVKILECFTEQETTKVDLQEIKDMMEKGGEE